MRTTGRSRLVTAAALAVVAVIAVSAFVVVTASRRPAPALGDAAQTSATPSATEPSDGPTADPDPAMPPAWLAWIAGSLPPGLAAEAAREAALDSVVVVAGDTRWMDESRDADGRRVDRPDPPLRIPIDAFAVAPRDYAPFLPPAWRDEVTSTLARGRAVLGETSAELRRIGPGGRLRFGAVTIEVGAVVPDEVVGYGEVLVSRERGRAIGIVHDRYLLALADDQLTDRRFARLMAGLIPGTAVETLRPGASPFMRIASGVNPPVVTKSIFGEFAAAPQPANPAFLTIDRAWVDANIRTRRVPLLGRVTCHRLLLGPLTDALTEIRAEGLSATIRIYSGCWAARTVQRSPTAPPSQHAYGAAIDINAPFSPFGAPPNFDPRAVAIFEAHGFRWGGPFLIPDGHHFEWGRVQPP